MMDALTSLPQRPAVQQWLAAALAGLPPRRQVAVGLVNVDGFSVVIESLGMGAADDALKLLTGRLQVAAADAGARLARAGGDEFALVLPQVPNAAEADRQIREVVEAAFGQPFSLRGQLLYLTASSGIAVSPPADPDELMRRATVALASIKRVGGGRAATYRSRPSVTLGNMSLYAELREAMERDELEAHFQPIIDVNDSHVVGLEALLRWNHPTRGVVGPAEFLPPIADSLLIEDLGLRVLRQACRDAAVLMSRQADLSYIAVNVAPRQLTSAEFPEHVLAALADAALSPHQLVLEVTETALVHDLSATLTTLNILRDHGVRVALDDFGTGYASLTSLRQLPIDLLKIDRTFVSGLGVSDQDATIVASVVALARSIGIEAVAEGVETQRQADAVRAVGCRLAQGFHWSAAVPAADLPATLARIAESVSAGRPSQTSGFTLRAGPVEARRIIELHRDGASPQTIAAALNRAGLRTSVGARWHATQVLRTIDAVTADSGAGSEPSRGVDPPP